MCNALYSVVDSVAITLDLPETRDALRDPMLDDLLDVLGRARALTSADASW